MKKNSKIQAENTQQTLSPSGRAGEGLSEFKQYLSAKGYTTDTTAGMIKSTTKFLMWVEEQNIEITTINYNDITAYIKLNQSRGIKARTTQIITTHVKHYLNYLVDAEIITHNPALALKLKNTKRKTVYNILTAEELETIYKNYKSELPDKTKSLPPSGERKGGYPPQALNKLARKRNKILLGLLIYQGITAEDVKNLEVNHLELREGKITIPGTRRSNERSLVLESHQVFDLYDYINDTRKAILKVTNKQTNQLIVSAGSSNNVQNLLQYLMKELTIKNSNIKNLDQIRASIITNWLKQYNKRKVQYMAGHRYVSSTEAYEANNIDVLQEDIEKFYPTL